MTEAAAERVAIAMDYPFARPGHSYLFAGGEVVALAEAGEGALDGALSQSGAAPMGERTAVLAYGANAAPSRLRRKFTTPGPGAVFPVLEARLHDFDIVYACHFSSYGAIPATPVPSPGTFVDIAVTYLDDGQLAHMHETELTTQNYVYGRLDGIALELAEGGRLDAVHSYWTRHGCFAWQGGPLALTAIAAQGRRFTEAAQQSAQGHARDRLAPGRDVDAFAAENAADPELRRQRSLALRAEALPFDHPHCQLLAG